MYGKVGDNGLICQLVMLYAFIELFYLLFQLFMSIQIIMPDYGVEKVLDVD